MLTFSKLGQLGRLGNQMFQYAALVGIAHNIRTDYALSSKNTALYECFDLPSKFTDIVNPLVSHTDKFEFDEKFYNSCNTNSDLYGFFQSEKYFSKVTSILKNHFKFKNSITEVASLYKKYLASEKEVIALHVRRTDYLTDGNFYNLDLSYYYQALARLPEVPVIILTDDYSWCKNIFTSNRFKISKSNSPYVDLKLMSLCSHHIIANSSFSWWGSWLADSRLTIAPKNWFAGNFSHWDTSDLYRPEWIII